jgi:hypothetical protein
VPERPDRPQRRWMPLQRDPQPPALGITPTIVELIDGHQPR